MHGSEEVVFDSENDGLLEELIAHQKLLARPGNVSVSMFNTHASETRLLHLESNQLCKIQTNLRFLCWMDTWVRGSSPDVKALITDLVYHYLKLIYKKDRHYLL